MLCCTHKRGARHASLIAGANLIVLGLSAGVSPARADNDWQCSFRQDDHYGMDDRDHTRLEHDSLAITASTYDNTQGAVTMLKIGSTLPNTDTATGTAVANNDYVNVWNNDNADGVGTACFWRPKRSASADLISRQRSRGFVAAGGGPSDGGASNIRVRSAIDAVMSTSAWSRLPRFSQP